MKRAYSYIRWSTGRQQLGDTKRRQVAEARQWADENGYQLDESYWEKQARSGYHGENLTKGALKAFRDAIEAGRVKPGSALIVENLDRLSRQQVKATLPLFLAILNAGIHIVTLKPSPRVYVEPDMMTVIELVVVAQRAWEESARKSGLSMSAWEKAIADYKATGRPIRTGHRPPWLTLDEKRDKWVFNAHARTLKKICRLSLDGLGGDLIAQVLNRDKTPPLRVAKAWNRSSVQALLHDHRLYGEATIRGEVIPGYYPPVITKKDWLRIQQGIAIRDRKGHGPRGDNVRNLFTGLVWDARSNTPMWISGKKSTSQPRLFPSGAVKGMGQYLSFPYPEFEFGVLAAMKGLNAKEFIAGDQQARDQLEATEGQLLTLEKEIEELTSLHSDFMREGKPVRTLWEKISDLEQQRNDMAGRVERLRAEAESPAQNYVANYFEILSGMNRARGEERLVEFRSRLRATIAHLVEQIEIVVEVVGKLKRDAWVRILYRGGKVEHCRFAIDWLKRSPVAQMSLNAANRESRLVPPMTHLTIHVNIKEKVYRRAISRIMKE